MPSNHRIYDVLNSFHLERQDQTPDEKALTRLFFGCGVWWQGADVVRKAVLKRSKILIARAYPSSRPPLPARRPSN
jgi:hypothetical protein